MPSQLVAVASLLLGSAFLLIAGGLHGILLPIRGAEAGFNLAELGLLGTGWSAGFISGCLLIPHVVRRVGHVRSYGALASVAAVTILLNVLFIDPVAWIAFRALNGFCFAGAAMVVESWLNERATRENRGTLFSVYQMVNFAASTTGQLLLVIKPPSDFFFFAIGAIFYCLAILPTALSTAKSPQPLTGARIDVKRLYEISPVGAVVSFLIGLVNGAFGTLGPVFGQQIGLPVRDISFMMAGALIGGSLIQFPLGWLSDRTDRRRVLIGVAVGAAVIGTTFAIFHPHTPAVVTVMAILFGAMIYPMYALTVAHANDFAASDEFVKIASSLLLLYGIGTMLGPLAAAYAMGHFAPEGIFVFTAAVHITIIGYVAYRITQRPTLNRVLRDAFQGLPVAKTATPESAVLDPRSPAPAEPVEVGAPAPAKE
ncbi:MAG TPA: MFS transporter [Bauldia sp.]|nr:MFS transporter [Bauldia sp.]